MDRKLSYWNQIPNHVVGGAHSMRVLKSWGFSFWPNSKDMDYIGWQRVHLPEGWTICFDGHRHLVLDTSGQTRGKIHGVLKRSTSPSGSFRKALEEAFAEVEKVNKKPLPVPRLEITRCISVRTSFSLSKGGPYSASIENTRGEVLFEIRDLFLDPDNEDAEWEEVKKRIENWLTEHYPRWKSPYFYWNRFA